MTGLHAMILSMCVAMDRSMARVRLARLVAPEPASGGANQPSSGQTRGGGGSGRADGPESSRAGREISSRGLVAATMETAGAVMTATLVHEASEAHCPGVPGIWQSWSRSAASQARGAAASVAGGEATLVATCLCGVVDVACASMRCAWFPHGDPAPSQVSWTTRRPSRATLVRRASFTDCSSYQADATKRVATESATAPDAAQSVNGADLRQVSPHEDQLRRGDRALRDPQCL
jgi:hypothetical protein